MSLSRLTLILSDIAALLGSLWLGYQIRFDFSVPAATQHTFPLIFLWVIAVKEFCLWRFRRYELLLGHFTVSESSSLFWALLVPSLFIFGVSNQLGSDYAPPRSVVLTDFGFSVIGLTAIRLAFRPRNDQRITSSRGLTNAPGGRELSAPVSSARRSPASSSNAGTSACEPSPCSTMIASNGASASL